MSDGPTYVRVRGDDFRAWLRARGWEPDRLHPRESEFLRVAWEYERSHPPAPAAGDATEVRAAGETQSGGLAITGRAVLAAAGKDKKDRRFEIVAYTGEPLDQGYMGWGYKVVVDMDGIDAGNGVLPVLDNHGPPPFSPVSGRGYVVGQSDSAKVEKGEFVLRGKMLEVTQAAKEIIALADAGFAWQTSIGATCLQKDFVAEGNSVEVNGRTYEGPVYVARKTVIREVSFVVVGADRHTSAVVATGTGSKPIMAKKTFASYCKAHGKDPDKMDEKTKARMKARFEEDDEDDDEDDKDKKDKADAKATATGSIDLRAGQQSPPVAQPVTAGDVIAQYREEVAAEHGRVAAIHAALAGYPGLTAEVGGKPVGLAEHAIHTLFRGRIGLQQLLATAAAQNGYRGREVISDANLEAILRAAFRPDVRADGASTISAPNVFANVLNKFLLQGYLFVENTWRQICSVIPTKDFKPTKSINIFGDFVFKKVDQNGQLQNAALTDEAFANQVDTFGRILNLNRQSIINDDLNALTGAPMLLGIGSADAVNISFWTLYNLMASNNAASNWADGNPFWYNRTIAVNQLGGAAINTNVISGGSSALSSASLQTAWYAYDKQVKPNSQPLGAEAEILLVPPELWVTGWELTDPAAAGIVYGGASAAKQPNINIWRGRLRLLKSRYLSNSNYTGSSATAWYLLANPMVLPVIQVAFLNGQEQPTVQTAQADFDTLGIRIRGFHDFGVAAQNPRGGVRAAGA